MDVGNQTITVHLMRNSFDGSLRQGVTRNDSINETIDNLNRKKIPYIGYIEYKHMHAHLWPCFVNSPAIERTHKLKLCA